MWSKVQTRSLDAMEIRRYCLRQPMSEPPEVSVRASEVPSQAVDRLAAASVPTDDEGSPPVFQACDFLLLSAPGWILVAASAQEFSAPERRLMQSIAASATAAKLDAGRWPLELGAGLSEQCRFEEYVGNFVEAEVARQGAVSLISLGAASLGLDFAPPAGTAVTIAPSLAEMLASPQLKRELWHKIRPDTP